MWSGRQDNNHHEGVALLLRKETAGAMNCGLSNLPIWFSVSFFSWAMLSFSCSPRETNVGVDALVARQVARDYLINCETTTDLERRIPQEFGLVPGFERIREIWARPLKKQWVDAGRPLTEDHLEGRNILLFEFTTQDGNRLWVRSGHLPDVGFYCEDIPSPVATELLSQFEYVEVYRSDR